MGQLNKVSVVEKQVPGPLWWDAHCQRAHFSPSSIIHSWTPHGALPWAPWILPEALQWM